MFPFLNPVLDKMNLTLIPSGFLDFFLNVIQRIKMERQKNNLSVSLAYLIFLILLALALSIVLRVCLYRSWRCNFQLQETDPCQL